MINEERLRPMVRMARFDKNNGKACKPMIQYARPDYVSMELLKSFISGSIAFAILCVMWGLYDTSALLGMLNGTHIKGFIIGVGIRYIIFLIVYLIATYIVYQIRYTKGRKLVKGYYKDLKNINNHYEREEKLKSPAQIDWE